MTTYADVPYLLALAECMPGDPQVDDLGVLVAASERHRAVLMQKEVYETVTLKAAALLHSLARMPCLESHNATFAWISAAGFLSINGHKLDAPRVEAEELLRAVIDGRVGVKQIAARLKEWS